MNPSLITDDRHQFLLEIYFFKYIDQGRSIDATPLFTGTFEGRDLLEVLQEWFSISKPEVAALLEAARKEVEL